MSYITKNLKNFNEGEISYIGLLGYHLILDCKSGNLEKVRSAENIEQFVKTLVTEIDMVACGQPKINILLLTTQMLQDSV